MRHMHNYFKSLFIIAGFFSHAIFAATVPTSITDLNAVNNSTVFSVTSKGWSDPAFGNAGWTHNSGWGSFYAQQGQMVSLIMNATEVGIHPGATIWFRGNNDTAPDNYVVDHFYNQTSDLLKFGATDEGTGEKIGNIVMEHIRHGYDLDANSVNIANPTVRKLQGKVDKIPGRLVLNVKIPYTGNYMFVVGGFNPDNTIDTNKNYTINVSIKIK